MSRGMTHGPTPRYSRCGGRRVRALPRAGRRKRPGLHQVPLDAGAWPTSDHAGARPANRGSHACGDSYSAADPPEPEPQVRPPARSTHWLTRTALAETGKGKITMTSSMKRRLAWRIGAVLAAAAASATLGVSAAS